MAYIAVWRRLRKTESDKISHALPEDVQGYDEWGRMAEVERCPTKNSGAKTAIGRIR